jgi:hypothetical protein
MQLSDAAVTPAETAGQRLIYSPQFDDVWFARPRPVQGLVKHVCFKRAPSPMLIHNGTSRYEATTICIRRLMVIGTM